jgi:hypothetical protein
MGRGWKWAATLAGAALVLAASTVFDWRALAVLLIGAGLLIAAAVFIVRDSAERGRSGSWWLVACVLLPPLALPTFVIFAVSDRLQGRRGIESRWAPAGRWFLLVGLVLTIGAAGLAVSQVRVASASVSAPGASASFSGSCSSALSVYLGAGTYGRHEYWPATAPASLTAARVAVAGRCQAAADARMTASAICLGGALLLGLTAQSMNRRRRRQQRQALALP